MRFADFVIAMKDGKVIKKGSPEEIMTKEVFSDVFMVDANIILDEKIGKKVCSSYEIENRSIYE